MLFGNNQMCFFMYMVLVWCSELCQNTEKHASTVKKESTTKEFPLTDDTKQSTATRDQLGQVAELGSIAHVSRVKYVPVNPTKTSEFQQTVTTLITDIHRTTDKVKEGSSNDDLQNYKFTNDKNRNSHTHIYSTSIVNDVSHNENDYREDSSNNENDDPEDISNNENDDPEDRSNNENVDPEDNSNNENDDPEDSPCSSYLVDGLNLMNCSRLSLSSFNSSWFPTNTNIVLLDGNELKSIPSFAFSNLRDLVQLSISGNRIKKIEDHAFEGLDKLEYLNLEDNDLKLDHSTYPPGVFDTMRNLNQLRLMNNVKNSVFELDGYPDNFLGKLQSLEHLTIDSSGNTIFFGSEFGNLTKLSRLEIEGSSRNIDESSFTNVRTIIELYLIDFPQLINFSQAALQPLKKLNILSLDGVRIGVTKSLLALKPLQGRNMTTVYFEGVDFFAHDRYSSFIMNDGVLDSTKTKHLTRICVESFSLINSGIYVLQADAFAGPVWNRCLRNIDLSSNPLVGTKASYFRIFNFKNIQTFVMENRMRDCENVLHDNDNPIDPPNDKYVNNFVSSKKQELVLRWNKNWKCLKSGIPQTQGRSYFISRSNSARKLLTKSAITSLPEINDFVNADSGFFWATISDSLRTVKLKNSISSSRVDQTLKIIGAKRLTYLDLSFNKLRDFTGNITGFEGLQTFILSGNQMSSLSEALFDNFPLLESLYLSECLLDADFMLRKSGRVLANLPWLKKLDISRNLLNFLASDTFRTNANLQEINLSKNRFKTIPFNLNNTPLLQVLDLRENSISTIEADQRNHLDKIAKQPGGFNLLLSGNTISCECDNLPFLLWIQTTDVQLDQGVNFRCAGDTDDKSFVSVMNDLESYWRKCNGRFFFSIATSLLLSMTIGFLTVFFVRKHGTFIKSSILRLFAYYMLKGPADYKIGVYIGYSLSDYRFPCFRLTPFFEDVLRLRTYVFHRDMSSPDMASNTVDAINNSWRTVLVFNESFLRDEWATFIYRSAIHSQTVENPSRVVVLVESSLQHQLPAELLGAVVEDNIIVVPRWEMTYHLREKLRIRLQKSS